jgi:hypothetical protein
MKTPEAGSWKRLGSDSPLEPSERAKPCRHLDLRLLTSRTVGQKVARFVLIHHDSPRELIQLDRSELLFSSARIICQELGIL